LDTKGFLEALYGDEAPGHIVLWTRQDKKTRWYDSKNLKAIATAANNLAKTKDVYFGISIQDKATAVARKVDTRGYADTSLACPGVWLDLDIQGAAHKSDKLPASLDDALRLIGEFPLKPSVLVHSGHGIQAWWLYKELWVFESPDEQKEAQDLVYRFQMTMKAKAEKHKWEIDSTFDLARVLRLPGTFNRKLEPEPVRVIQENDNRYNPYDFEEYLIDVAYLSSKEGDRVNPVGVLAGVPMGQRDNVLFRYACRLRNKGMEREEAEVLVCQAAANCKPPFPEVEAKEKVASAWKYPEGNEASQIVSMLPEFPERVWEPECIGALAILKEQEPAEFGKIRAELKGRVNLNDLDRAVKKQIMKNHQLRVVDPGEKPPLLEEILPDIPLKELRRPYKWTLNENGIWQDTKNGPVCACAVPVILTKRLQNVDTNEEKIELGFYRDNKWQYVMTSRTTVFSRNTIVQLTTKSLPVSSENARDLVRYLSDLERENLTTLPIEKASSHLGWVGGHFIPGAQGNIVLDIEDGGSVSISHGYRQQGTLKEWIEQVKPLREYPLARFILAASFATPLLKILNQRVFIIHAWGPSRGGKTAALKAALSVWGDPEDTMASFNATKVGLERLAALYQDLPLGIDERQVVGDKQGFIDSLVYMLGTGKGKARGAKGGGLQHWNYWRTIVLTTGEEPLSTNSSTAGISTRTLELYGLPIPSETISSRLHKTTKEQFGTAGPAWIAELITALNADTNMVVEDHLLIEEKLKEWHGDKVASHRAAIAQVVQGDYYSSMWLFGLERKEALQQALKLAETIFSQLETAKEYEDAFRAYDYLISWYNVNATFFNFFEKGDHGQRYGMIDERYLYLFPTVFERAITEGGFNPKRILKDWAENNLIQTEMRSGKKRYKVRKYDNVLGTQTYYVAVKLLD
jgi:hypothetical protein